MEFNIWKEYNQNQILEAFNDMSQNCQFDEFIQEDFINNIYPQLIDFLENNDKMDGCFLNDCYEKASFGAQTDVYLINNKYVIKFLQQVTAEYLKNRLNYFKTQNDNFIFMAPTYGIKLRKKFKPSTELKMRQKDRQLNYNNEFNLMVFQPYFIPFINQILKYKDFKSPLFLDINRDNFSIANNKIICFDW